jgi:ABC-2 type transport system ATP-binding protein
LIGTTPQETGFPATVTVEEILRFAGSHYREALPAPALLQRFGLERVARRQTGGLSGGERRRLAVALSLVGRPKAIFLDEPTTGLDVESRHEVWRAVRAYADDGGTVLLTTHYLDEAEALASHVTVLIEARVARTGTVSEIKSAAGLRKVRLSADDLPRLPEAESTVRAAGAWTIHTNDTDAVLRRLVEHGVGLGDIEVLPVSLEEAFLRLVRDSR